MTMDQVLVAVGVGFGVSFFVYFGMKTRVKILLSRVEDISFKCDRLSLEKEDILRKHKISCEERDINRKYKDLFNATKKSLSRVNLELEESKKWKEKYLSLRAQKKLEVEDVEKKYDLLAAKKDLEILEEKKKYNKLKDISESIHAQFNSYKRDSGFEELERKFRREVEHWKGRCLDSERVKKENENVKLQISSLIREKASLESKLNSANYDKSIAAREISHLESKLSDLETEYSNIAVKVSGENSKPEITYYNENPTSDFYPLNSNTISKTLSGGVSKKMSSVSCELFRQHMIKNGFSEKYYKKAADYSFWRVGKSLFAVRANQFADSVGSKGFITKSIQRVFGKEINWGRYPKNSNGEVKVNDMRVCDFNILVKNYVTY